MKTLFLVLALLVVLASSAFAVDPTVADLFTSAGTQITTLTGMVVTMLLVGLTLVGVGVGYNWIKRGFKSAK
ncbi:MAG: hypothetical protein HQL10_14000 [Nitrospirae bacterium]|nr:hypothetical protein [Nitrospirota bacterium]